MRRDSKIYVAGHRGLVGSAIMRALKRDGYENIITRTHAELDLTEQSAVREFFTHERPEYVFLAAAKVGGIGANSRYPADFIYENLAIETNVIHAAWRSGVEKLLFLGSSCIYPKLAPQPIKEDYLLSGALERTNDAYAIAKIAGLEMCRHFFNQYGAKFISVMPTNLYGPEDNFDLENSHVLPALIRKFHEAKISSSPAVELWGTGTPRREFLHVDDMAAACVFLMNSYDNPQFLNVGTGNDVTIKELAQLVSSVAGYDGKITWDSAKPDGTPRKLLDVSRLKSLGWAPQISLEDGIKTTYEWYISKL